MRAGIRSQVGSVGALLELNVDTRFLLILDVNARLDLGLESFPRDGDRVIADFDEREGVVAVAVRDRSALFTSLNSKERNLCARDYCVGGVGDGAWLRADS